jgi:predicted outer membrane protein
MKHRNGKLHAVLVLAGGLLLTCPTSLRAQHMGGMGGSPQAGMGGGGQPQPGMNTPGMPGSAMNQQNNPEAEAERNFIGTMRRNIKAEAELSKVALKQSSNDNVKKFAQQVIAENRRLGTSLANAASSANMMVPDSLPSQTKNAMKQMKKQTGTQFDATYISQMDGYIKSDQQTASAAAGTLNAPNMQGMTTQLRTTAENRAQQLAQIAQSENFKLQ